MSFAGTSGGGERSDFRPVWCIPQGISPARVGNPRGFWGIRGSARKADGSGIPGGRGVETSARAGDLDARLMVQIPEPPASAGLFRANPPAHAGGFNSRNQPKRILDAFARVTGIRIQRKGFFRPPHPLRKAPLG